MKKRFHALCQRQSVAFSPRYDRYAKALFVFFKRLAADSCDNRITMIVFDLVCRHCGHIFEAWFASVESFDQQKERGLLECPICGNTEIDKRLTAKVRNKKIKRPETEPTKQRHVAIPSATTDMIARLRQIVSNTENVGERFPEEARKMHYHETPLRPIRGQAAQNDIEALAEEGIDIDILPDFLFHDLN